MSEDKTKHAYGGRQQQHDGCRRAPALTRRRSPVDERRRSLPLFPHHVSPSPTPPGGPATSSLSSSSPASSAAPPCFPAPVLSRAAFPAPRPSSRSSSSSRDPRSPSPSPPSSSAAGPALGTAAAGGLERAAAALRPLEGANSGRAQEGGRWGGVSAVVRSEGGVIVRLHGQEREPASRAGPTATPPRSVQTREKALGPRSLKTGSLLAAWAAQNVRAPASEARGRSRGVYDFRPGLEAWYACSCALKKPTGSDGGLFALTSACHFFTAVCRARGNSAACAPRARGPASLPRGTQQICSTNLQAAGAPCGQAPGEEEPSEEPSHPEEAGEVFFGPQRQLHRGVVVDRPLCLDGLDDGAAVRVQAVSGERSHLPSASFITALAHPPPTQRLSPAPQPLSRKLGADLEDREQRLCVEGRPVHSGCSRKATVRTDREDARHARSSKPSESATP